MNLLTVSNLSCTRGEQSLFENLSFSVNIKQCLHIRGVNGSGKTSLLRMLAGLLKCEHTNIDWHDSSFSYLAHKDGLKNELSAIENLRFYYQLDASINLSKQQSENNLDHILNQIGLLKKADTPVKNLSFGQRRRLAFARLLLIEASVWILDEPLTGVDTDGRHLIEQHCLSHIEAGGAILISHHGDLSQSRFSKYCSTLDLN